MNGRDTGNSSDVEETGEAGWREANERGVRATQRIRGLIPGPSDLSLHVPKVIRDATLRVEWFLAWPLLQRLTIGKDQGKEYCLLLVVVNQKGEEERYLVPLKQGAEYIVLHQSGVHRIFAVVVPQCDSQLNEAPDTYLQRYHDDYSTTVLLYNGQALRPEYAQSQAASVEVNVPEEALMPAPAPWLVWWVNLRYKKPHRDNCEFKKRAFRAFSTQLVSVPIQVLGQETVAVLFGLLTFVFLGPRAVRWRTILHPFQDQWWDVVCIPDGPLFFPSYTGRDREKHLVFFYAPLLPLVFMPVFAGAYLVAALATWSIGMAVLASAVRFTGSFMTGAFLVMCILQLLSLLWAYSLILGERLDVAKQWWQQIEAKIDKSAEERERQRAKAAYEALSPDFVGNRQQALPFEQRMHLRFWATKARLCKPAAR